MSESAESEYKCQRLYGATVARLTPDQKVGSSNLSAVIFVAYLAKPNLRACVTWRLGYLCLQEEMKYTQPGSNWRPSAC